VSTFIPPAKLGVGFTYQQGLSNLDSEGELIDFYEITPDVLCYERTRNGEQMLEYHPVLFEDALRETADRPIVVHGLGLSIGSATGWNESYLKALEILQARRPFSWHSEHLNFLTTRYPDGRPLHTGVPLPVPFTDEALDLIAPRAAALSEEFGTPFLLENLTYYLPGVPADRKRDEVTFLNDLVERSNCGLLLDLYNLYCNAVNFGFDPVEALSRMRLDRVVEIHVAGGVSNDGFLMDVHSRGVPEPVWRLLEWVVPQAPNLAGIVYELLEEALPRVGVSGIRHQLELLREVWEKHSAVNEERAAYVIN
jgi:uncharacterized protein (UPF0276 family)